MKKFLFQLCISSLILFYLIFKIDRQILVGSFRDIEISFFILSTCVALSAPIVKAYKYFLLIRGTALSVSVIRLVKIDFIARFYGLILPSALGPAAIRWYKLTKNKNGKSFFLASTMVERLIFIFISLLCGTIPLFFYSDNPAIISLRQNLFGLMVVAYTVLITALIYFFSSTVQNFFNRTARSLIRIKNDSKADQFLNNFSLKDSSLTIIGALSFLSLLWQFIFLSRIYFLFHSISISFSFIEAMWMGSIVLLLQILPVSFAGIGVREGAYAYLFTLLGLPAEKGFLVGVLFLAQMLIVSAIGAVCTLFEGERPSDNQV